MAESRRDLEDSVSISRAFAMPGRKRDRRLDMAGLR